MTTKPFLQTESNSSVSINVPPGKYTVTTSLCSNGSWECYPFPDPGHLNYTLSITTGSLTAAEKLSVDGGLDSAPVINNDFATLILDSRIQSPYKVLIDARMRTGMPSACPQ